MECKNVQDRLLTDYLDRELDETERTGIDRHLAGCPDCAEFLEAVRKTAVIPFKEAGLLNPDEAVWERIREKIEAERLRSESWFGKMADKITPALRIPLPVFRIAFVTAVILVTLVVAKWPSGSSAAAYAYVEEQMTFMGELSSGNTDLLNGDLRDYEAVIAEMDV